MAFIGVQPTSAPLTSSDITDGIISTAKIADDAVTSAKIPANAVTDSELNLGSNFAFTGTVSGTPTSKKLLRTITISSNTNSISFVHGANGVVLDSTYSRYEITVDSAVPSTNAVQILLLVSTNGGSSYHTTDAYNSSYHRHYSNGSSTGNDSAYVNDFALNHDQSMSSTASNGGVDGSIVVTNLGTAHRTVFNGNFFGFGSGSYLIHTNTIGAYASSSATINAIAIAFASGDIASGKFKLFGVN